MSNKHKSDWQFCGDLIKLGLFFAVIFFLIHAGGVVQDKYFPDKHKSAVAPKTFPMSTNNATLDDYFSDKPLQPSTDANDEDQLGNKVEKKNEVMCERAPITSCVSCPGEKDGQCRQKTIGFFRKYVKDGLKKAFYSEPDDDLFMRMVERVIDKDSVRKYAEDNQQYESCVTDKDSCPANLRSEMPEK